jgi:hypothetical protein
VSSKEQPFKWLLRSETSWLAYESNSTNVAVGVQNWGRYYRQLTRQSSMHTSRMAAFSAINRLHPTQYSRRSNCRRTFSGPNDNSRA